MKPSEALNIAFGEFMIGEMVVALNMDELREVIPHSRTQPIAAQGQHVVGGLNLRGTMVPVIDLSVLFASKTQQQASQCIVIIGSKGRLLGLVASKVNCLFSVYEPEIQTIVSHDEELQMMQGSVFNPQTNQMVSILSADKIMALKGVPHVIQKSVAVDHQSSIYADSSRKPTELPLLLMRSGEMLLAAQPSDIETTIPRAELLKNDHVSGYYRGNVLYRGKEIPAVDFLAYLNIGQESKQANTTPKEQAFVIRYAKGSVAFLIDQITDIVRVEANQVIPLPNLEIFKQGALNRIIKETSIYPITDRGENYYIIDPNSLLNDQRLIDLAELLDRSEAERHFFHTNDSLNSVDSKNKNHNLSVIRFEIDTQYAVPLHQVKEVIAYRNKKQFLKSREPLCDIVTHRDKAIPVYDLAQCLGKEGRYSDETSNLLLTTIDQQTVAFAVGYLDCIDTARLTSKLPLLGIERAIQAHHQVTEQQLVETRIDQKPTLLQLIDLHALARRHVQPAPVQDMESICKTACLSACAPGTPENNCCPTSTEGTA